MPVTINLGRINKCKIVGTKNRFIEVRCGEESVVESWDCDAQGNCFDPGTGQGQYLTEAACLAAPPYSNNCVTAGQTDSGVYGNQGTQYDWMVTNNHLAINFDTYYFESVSCGTNNNTCLGPNGGCYSTLAVTQVKDASGTVVGNFTTVNDTITFLNGLGIAVTNADDYITINTAIETYYGSPNSGLQLGGQLCECTGCGSPAGASWDCYTGAAGNYCQDPGTGNGQYSSLAACNAALAAGGSDSCADNSDTGAARVNATPGTIYADPQEFKAHLHEPAIVNQNLNGVFFECYDPTGYWCANNTNPNTVCCKGPNWTSANPTCKVYLTDIGYNWIWNNTDTNRLQGACAGEPCHIINSTPSIPFLTGDFESYYGQDGACNRTPFSWNDILQDAIAAGVPGVTTSTPFADATGYSAGVGTLSKLMTDWVSNNPAICTQYGGDGMMTFEVSTSSSATIGPYQGVCAVNVCSSMNLCYCEDTCATPTYDCDPHTQQCYDPGNGLGPYTGPTALADCQAAGCGGPAPSWDCVDGDCIDPGTGAGPYVSWAACVASGGVNTCVDAGFTFTSAYDPYPIPGGWGNSNIWAWLQANPTLQVDQYYYEIPCGGGPQDDDCVGPNGGCLTTFQGLSGVFGDGVSGTGDVCTNTLNANCNIAATYADWITFAQTFVPTLTLGMTWTQVFNEIETVLGPANTEDANGAYTWGGAILLNSQNTPIGGGPFNGYCQCTDCGSNPYECVPGSGCIQQAGGQYPNEAACLAANGPTDTCDTTTLVPSPQANPLAAALELSTNYSTVDITTLSTQIVAGADPCKPPLLPDQTHCIGKEGHPLYTFAGYTFIDAVTGGPLTGLASSYTKWSDFLTAAQAIPIAGISGSTTFNDACTALQSHYNVTPAYTCPIPLTTDVVPGTWNPGPGVNGLDTTTGLIQYISTQGNTYANKNGSPLSDYTWIVDNSYSPAFCGTGGCSLPPGSNCDYMMGPYFMFINFVGPNGPFYYTWDDALADLIAINIPGVTSTSTWCDVTNCSDSAFQGFLQKFNADYDISVGFSPCECQSTSVQATCDIITECCVCEDGCGPVQPPARGECLTLWLHADRMDTIKTQPAYPVVPPNLAGTTYYITEWFNLAYSNAVGVYPYDPDAFYTWDTITPDFTTAPILDTITFAPHNAIMFDEIGNNQKFLIANPAGPAVLPLEPNTNPNPAYDKGWTIFFRRCTTEAGWINAKSWFMGDDWTQSTPAATEKASGLKPHGQPYCRSVMLGHNHADESVPDNEYEASAINENNPGGGELYLPEGCYTHWIRACETKPTGTAGNTFDVVWGIGPFILFKDQMKDVNMDMILQNINTRNRDKTETQAGWYQEIRAYNCCFDKIQIKAEFSSIDAHWGPTLMPQQLPKPCGSGPQQVGNVLKFDGVDQTRVEVVEAGGNESILPSNAGFTAAFWVRMDDCVDDDVCFFEKGINLPSSNEEVAFRLFLSDDVGQTGNLYWDVFGDAPIDYNGNYSRTISNTPWLGESSCANLIGKWKHVAVTMEGIRGLKRKIYVNGVDITGVNGGALASGITGKVRRNSNYPLVIGDSSRPDYTFKGEFSQFMTWNKSLSKDEVQDVYNNGGMWAPDVNVDTGFSKILGIKPYEDDGRLTFYTNFDSDPITHETQHTYTITKYGGVTLENTTDVDNAVLPTDIKGLQCWFRANTKQLFDLDVGNNKISRATYMLGNTPHLKDKIRIWECHGNTGRYCMPDAVNTQTEKMLYQQTTEASAIIEPGGLYSNGAKQLQIFHTRADGGIQFPVADGTNGAFTIMIKIRLEEFSNEAVYGNTTDNMMRVNNTTTVRYKIGGAGSADFTVPSAMTDAQPYIFTLQRDAAGVLSAYIDGGAFTDQALTGSFTDTDAFVIDYLGGVPSQGMQGWIFDFIAWGRKLNDPQRKAQYRTINQTIRTL